MTASILAIISGLVALVLFLVKRRAAQKDDPLQRHEERRRLLDEAILQGNQDALNNRLDDHLRELQKRQDHPR